VAFGSYYVVATVAGLVEFAVSLPIFQYLHLQGVVAFLLAVGVTTAAILFAHVVGGALREGVKRQRQSTLVKLVTGLCFVLGLTISITYSRVIGLRYWALLREGLHSGASTESQDVRGVVVTSALVTLGMIAMAAIFRYMTEYGDGRFGLAELESQQTKLRRQMAIVEAQQQRVKTIYDEAIGAVKDYFGTLRERYLEGWRRMTAKLWQKQRLREEKERRQERRDQAARAPRPKCPHCGREVDIDGAKVCTKCGGVLAQPIPPS